MKHNFKPYLNPIFIETGTYGGDGVNAALSAGFKRVISIEVSNYYYSLCRERFKYKPKVELYFGDSLEILPVILKDINQRCTFWLDGHLCGGYSEQGLLPVPLMEEIQIIAQHPIKNHTFLIDDMSLLRNRVAEWKHLKYTTNDIEKVIRSINPDYSIVYIGGAAKQDILCAEVK